MKVVYAGWKSGTCLSRCLGLQKLLDEPVTFFDTLPYFESAGAWTRRFEALSVAGPRHARLNADLLALCRAERPDLVWVDRGVWAWPSTLRALRAQGTFLVHHFTDALFPHLARVRWSFRVLRKTLPLYDLNFTSNVDDHAWMCGRGIATELTYLGYDGSRFDATPLPHEVEDKWASRLLFIGHHEARTERGILALLEAGLPLKVYGLGWERARARERLREAVRFRPLSDSEYVYALKAADMALCFVSEINYNQTAGRSFEIPACGTFLLAMRTPQHLECYQEGVEAEFFGDTDELVRKARYYLEHDEERRRIARAGHDRCVQSEYTWQRYMRDDWAKVLAAFKEARGQRSEVRSVAENTARAASGNMGSI